MSRITGKLLHMAQDVLVNGLAGLPFIPSQLRYLLLRWFPGFTISRSVIEASVQWWGSGLVTVGSRSFINRACLINHSGAVAIGSGVQLGPGVALLTASHETGPSEQRAGRGTTAPITVQDGAWLGARVTVMPGVTIGRGAVVGAGSLVLSDVPPNTVYAGSPAKFVRKLDVEPAQAR